MHIAYVDLISKIRSKQIITHVIFWVLVFFFYRYFFAYSTNNGINGPTFSLMLLPLTIVVTYFFIYCLIPKYLLTKRYVKFGLYGFYSFIISVDFIGITVAIYFLLWADMKQGRMPFVSQQFVYIVVLVFLVVLSVSFVKILSENFKKEAKNNELKNKILEAELQLKNQELDYLKKQIHPHFLFNSLNTIYGLALQKDEATPDVILKLSNLLDYILYQVSKPLVSLEKEVNHIEEYIALEEVRFKDSLNVELKKGQIAKNTQVAPMLLIPFVENAFKHGNKVAGKLKVKIDVEMHNGNLYLQVENSWNKGKDSFQNQGIGLSNIRKRLDLLYPEKYSLTVIPNEESFKIELIVNNLQVNG